jgi:cytochrome c553
MLLLKQDERRPGDPGLRAQKALTQAISAETLADLAAYYSSVR